MTYTDISISHLATMPDIIIHLSHEQLEELLQKNKVVINMGSSDVFLPIHALNQQGTLRGEGIGGLFRIFRNFRLGGAADVAGRGSDAEGIGTCLSEPLRIGLVERGKVTYRNRHCEGLALAGLQLTGLGEGLQLLGGLFQSALRSSDIDLCHFLTTDTTTILNSDANIDALTLGLDHRLRELESGVGETIAEGIGHVAIEGIEEAITHIDILLVVRVGMTRDGHSVA